jgi:hypothetical protein
MVQHDAIAAPQTRSPAWEGAIGRGLGARLGALLSRLESYLLDSPPLICGDADSSLLSRLGRDLDAESLLFNPRRHR